MAARSVHSPAVAVWQMPSAALASGASLVELTVKMIGEGLGHCPVPIGVQVGVGTGPVGVGVIDGVGVQQVCVGVGVTEGGGVRVGPVGVTVGVGVGVMVSCATTVATDASGAEPVISGASKSSRAIGAATATTPGALLKILRQRMPFLLLRDYFWPIAAQAVVCRVCVIVVQGVEAGAALEASRRTGRGVVGAVICDRRPRVACAVGGSGIGTGVAHRHPIGDPVAGSQHRCCVEHPAVGTAACRPQRVEVDPNVINV